MATQHARSPYKGAEPSLVIAIDVGTTYSGASYTVLTPNQVPKIVDVTGFKGQEDKSSSTKVPSVLFYDSSGYLLACGSEADEENMVDPDFVRVEWFKLLLRPLSLDISLENAPDTRLPYGKTVLDVFGDFLAYMRNCVKDYLIKSEVDGRAVWQRLGENAHYVLTHPNGWEGYQQAQMRNAAILGGLAPDEASARERIEFVTEGEASFHWCVDIGLANTVLNLNSHVIVADAGGGTIDVSSFRVTSLRPLKLEETAAPECRVAGSVFVTHTFKRMLEEKLESSRYGTDEYIERATQHFETKTKCLFRDKSNVASIRLGSRRDNDIPNNIRMGLLSLSGSFIADAFEDSCAGAADAIRLQLRKNQRSNATIFLVGGFAASPWLYSELERGLAYERTEITRADSHTSKAVAHGAVAYYLDHYIASRIAKHTYGVAMSWRYDSALPSHRERSSGMYTCGVSGEQIIDGGFTTLVKRGDTIKADAVYRTALEKLLSTNDPVEFSTTIERYTGSLTDISFRDMDTTSSFYQLCTFSAKIPSTALAQRYGTTGWYWYVPFEVVINLGTSELTCHLEWKENGENKRSIAASVWEDI